MPNISDRWLWVGFGIFFYTAAKAIRYGLVQVYELNQQTPTGLALLPHQPPALTAEDDREHRPSTPDTRPEDSISLSALAALARSPNRALAASATSILTARFLSQPSEHEAWLHALFSPQTSTRTRAARLLSFFREGSVTTAAEGDDDDDDRNDSSRHLARLLPSSSPVRILAPLIDISLGPHPMAAATVQAAYNHVHSKGGSRAKALLANIAVSMRVLGDLSVLLCPRMTEAQTGPWLDSMLQLLWPGSEDGNSRCSLEKSLWRMHAAGGGETGADGEEDDGLDGAAADLSRLNLRQWQEYWEELGVEGNVLFRTSHRRDIGDDERSLSWQCGHDNNDDDDDDDDEHEPLLHLNHSRSSVAPRRRGGAAAALPPQDLSFEEIEIRRRRREAMVLHEGVQGIYGEDDIHNMPHPSLLPGPTHRHTRTIF